MKRAIILIASVFLVISAAGGAAAEMVNIGPVAIDRSDDIDIRNRVAGGETAATPAAPRTVTVNIGVAEIGAADHAALQDYVSGRKAVDVRSGNAPRSPRADIGVVDMSQTDHQELENLTSWMKGKTPGRLLLENLHAQAE
jgi:hypothetical protein